MDDIWQADSINCEVCDFCPSVHVNLFDKAGRLCASASVPVENGEEFIKLFRECMAESGKRVPAPRGRQ